MENRLVRAYRSLRKSLVYWLRKEGMKTIEDAEDVSMAVWAELLVHVRSRKIRYWSDSVVYHIARNRLLDYINKHRNRKRLTALWKPAELVETDIDTDILIRRLVASLPSDERAVIENLYELGRTLQEVAAELNISMSTVKRLQSSALNWMRSQVESTNETLAAYSQLA